MTADPRVEAVAAALDTHYQRLTMDSVYQCACGVRGYRSEWPHHLAAVAVAQVNLLAPPETTEAVVEAAVARAVLAERDRIAAEIDAARAIAPAESRDIGLGSAWIDGEACAYEHAARIARGRA